VVLDAAAAWPRSCHPGGLAAAGGHVGLGEATAALAATRGTATLLSLSQRRPRTAHGCRRWPTSRPGRRSGTPRRGARRGPTRGAVPPAGDAVALYQPGE